MWIKKLYATFGKLSNKTLELGSGLNVVYGKNESGKSTWSSFIRAMFYGISTREQKKIGFLPDKEKFLPWNGEPMYGKMELSTKDGDITIERVASRSGVMSNVSARYDENGKDAPTGEELLGVSMSVYERTAFIRQSGIGVSQDKETEKRILSIASSGDESVSAKEVLERLKKWQRNLRHTSKSGEIPKLEAELEMLSEKLSEAIATEEEIARVAESLEACHAELKKRERELKIALAEEEKEKRNYITSAKAEFEAAANRKRETEKYPTRRELDIFLQKKNEVSAIRLEKEQGEKMSALFREELIREDGKLSSSPFAKLSETQARTQAEEDIAKIAAGRKKKRYLISCVALAIFAFFSVIVALFVSAVFLIVAVLFAAFSVGVLFVWKKGGEDTRELAVKYGASDEASIRRALSEYTEVFAQYCKISEKLAENDAENKKRELELNLHTEDIKRLISQFSLDEEGDLTAVEKKLSELVLLAEAADIAEKEARARVEALIKASDVSDAEIEYTEEEVPLETSTEIEEEIKLLSEQGKRYEIALATLKTSLSDISTEKANKEREEILKKLSELNFRYEALSLAIDTLDEAEVELKNRFSPEVEKRTSEIFRYLSGGSYEIVKIENSNFEMSVASGVATAPRETLSLSGGTVDELYFALRLALFETIVPKEEAPPLVLDDVFVNFDDERMKRALDLLLEMSKELQIIIFSCHSRETEYLKGKANITEL